MYSDNRGEKEDRMKEEEKWLFFKNDIKLTVTRMQICLFQGLTTLLCDCAHVCANQSVEMSCTLVVSFLMLPSFSPTDNGEFVRRAAEVCPI